MRTVEEIKADIAELERRWSRGESPSNYKSLHYALKNELRAALTADIPLDRLEAICAAEKDGRVVVLPCKVGDTVYVISHCENVMVHCDDDYETGTGFRECPFENSCEFEDCDDGNKRIFETTCTGFYLTDGKSDIFFEDLTAEFYLSDFGKTVFLTRAEAEAALAQDGGQP